LQSSTTTLQESEVRLEELLEETSQRSTISISAKSQIYPLVTLLEDIGGLAEEHQWMEEHEEMYLVEHGDFSPLQQYTDLRDHLHCSSSCVSDDGWRMIDPQFVEIPTVVPDGWCSVMSTEGYLPWVPVDELLVKSMGLTKAYDTSQSYSWLQIFRIAFLDTFIIDDNTGRDRQWQGTWRVGRLRPPNRSVLMAYSKIGVDHKGQTVEALGVIESILGHGIEYISEVDRYSDSHWDEDGRISTTTSRAHQ
jgi:hypothetical protein